MSARVLAMVSIAVSIEVIAAEALLVDDIEIDDPDAGVLVDACAAKPISETLSPDILITSPSECVKEILPLKVTEAALETVLSEASV